MPKRGRPVFFEVVEDVFLFGKERFVLLLLLLLLLLVFVHFPGDEDETAGIFFGMIFEPYFTSLIYDLMRCFYDAT